MKPLPVRLQQALAATLGVWAVGVVLHEGIAAFGAWSTVALVLVSARIVRPNIEWSRWWALIAMLALAVLAPMIGGRLPTATGLARLSDWLLLPAAAFAVTQVSGRSLPRIGLIASAVLLVSCAVAATQYFGVWPRSSAFESLSWANLPFNRMDEMVPGRTDRFMAGGVLLHRLKFAHTGALAGTLLVAAALMKTPYRIVFAVAALVAVPAIIVFPHARTAAVALVAGCVVVVLAIDRRVALIAVPSLLITVVVLLWAMPSVRERFETGLSSEGQHEREVITQSGLTAISMHPLTGEGAGRFSPGMYAPADAPIPVLELKGKAHNQFISVAVEAGIPAAILLIVFLLGLTRIAWRNRPTSIPLLASLTVFVLLCMLHDPLYQPGPAMGIMLVLGSTLGLVDRQRNSG